MLRQGGGNDGNNEARGIISCPKVSIAVFRTLRGFLFGIIRQ